MMTPVMAATLTRSKTCMYSPLHSNTVTHSSQARRCEGTGSGGIMG